MAKIDDKLNLATALLSVHLTRIFSQAHVLSRRHNSDQCQVIMKDFLLSLMLDWKREGRIRDGSFEFTFDPDHGSPMSTRCINLTIEMKVVGRTSMEYDICKLEITMTDAEGVEAKVLFQERRPV